MKQNTEIRRKIPGMFYILVSFIPWIVYWVLCGSGNRLGVIIPFAISLLLVIPGIHKRDLNLMDVTSVFFFSIASLATFVLNLSIFVEKSGFLGYITLAAMALFSLIIRKPYTLQASKRDYPEIYWKDESFLNINIIITEIWVIIFIANATIFLFLEMPLTLILSNTLIAIGITFSIVFPLWAPAYFASKDFRKFDWKIRITPQGKNEHDVIIIGSGIGGLTCGALLSKRGYRVLVLEQHHKVGGFCSSFKRKGFVFNTGVENVSGLWKNGPITYLLKELGLKKDDFFVKNKMRYIFKGKIIDANDSEKFIKVLSDIFPEEKENIYFCRF